ncbi:MAG: TniB family NTP-binding protein [Thiobacillus sp.]
MHAVPDSITTQPCPPDARAPWQYTISQKLTLIKKLRVAFPAFQDAMDEIIEMVDLGDCALGFSGVFIIGESGSGKTTFLESILERYPFYERVECTVRPAVMAKVPSAPSIKFIARRILAALGDPLAYAPRRDNDELTKGIVTLLKECRTQVLLLDEVNNFLQKKGRHDSVLDLSNWIKEIVDLSGVLIVLSALPIGEAITQSNEQLRRRFSAPLYLELVKKNRKETNLTNFRGVLKDVDEKLPTLRRSNLHEKDLSLRLFYATDGLIGLLMKLLRRAIRIAHKRNAPQLDLAILEEAFMAEIWTNGEGPLNPFNQQFIRRRLDHVGEPYGPEVQSPAKRKGGGK